MESAARISPRALLLIQGAEDEARTPLSDAQAIYAAAGEPRDLGIVPDATQATAVLARPDEYRRRVLAFFDRNLSNP